jgi:hypothetical protein
VGVADIRRGLVDAGERRGRGGQTDEPAEVLAPVDERSGRRWDVGAGSGHVLAVAAAVDPLVVERETLAAQHVQPLRQALVEARRIRRALVQQEALDLLADAREGLLQERPDRDEAVAANLVADRSHASGRGPRELVGRTGEDLERRVDTGRRAHRGRWERVALVETGGLAGGAEQVHAPVRGDVEVRRLGSVEAGRRGGGGGSTIASGGRALVEAEDVGAGFCLRIHR